MPLWGRDHFKLFVFKKPKKKPCRPPSCPRGLPWAEAAARAPEVARGPACDAAGGRGPAKPVENVLSRAAVPDTLADTVPQTATLSPPWVACDGQTAPHPHPPGFSLAQDGARASAARWALGSQSLEPPSVHPRRFRVPRRFAWLVSDDQSSRKSPEGEEGDSFPPAPPAPAFPPLELRGRRVSPKQAAAPASAAPGPGAPVGENRTPGEVIGAGAGEQPQMRRGLRSPARRPPAVRPGSLQASGRCPSAAQGLGPPARKSRSRALKPTPLPEAEAFGYRWRPGATA